MITGKLTDKTLEWQLMANSEGPPSAKRLAGLWPRSWRQRNNLARPARAFE